MILDKVIDNTSVFIKQMPKTVRKEYGQFFTGKETAIYMSNLLNIPKKETLKILDAGAGSGILSISLAERLINIDYVKEVEITCYETDRLVLPLLQTNLDILINNSEKKITYIIKNENYILSQSKAFNDNLEIDKYDLIIGNPPYKKIPKNSAEAKALPSVCYGVPNLYFLFATLGLFNLCNNSEMVYIIPRSWTSGAYFTKFRQYLLSNSVITHLHLFESRDKVFGNEQVLQETMIIKIKKTNKIPKTIKITSTQDSKDFSKQNSIILNYESVISGKNKYVYLITKKEDEQTLNRVNKNKYVLPELNMRMKTGLTVDFRNKDILKSNFETGFLPLFYVQHIKNGIVNFPINKENQYIYTDSKGLLQENKNYLFVKRFTAKEEKQRLQCGIYLSKYFPSYEKISTQNKLNFIDGIGENLSEERIFGLYVLFNSSLYDNYYRILNGSTQVNSTEMNSIPVPDKTTIDSLGRELLKTNNLSQVNCDAILEKYNV